MTSIDKVQGIWMSDLQKAKRNAKTVKSKKVPEKM